MANSKSAPSKPRRKAGSGSSGGSAGVRRTSNRSAKAPSRPKPAAKSGQVKFRSGGRSTQPSSGPSAPKRGTVRQVAAKAKGPAVAVGVAAAGVAGARALKGRMGRKAVLGVPVPGWLGSTSLPDLDMRSLAKTIGEASQRFAETSKAVSKDIERVGDQAERIGRLLG
jgi:hypothetical protein